MTGQGQRIRGSPLEELALRRWWLNGGGERLRVVLLLGAVGSAVLTTLGGLASKSWAESSYPDGTGEGWTDGAKPSALWALLGGLAVLALLAAGWWWSERWWVLAAAGAVGLWHAGSQATAYRDQLEAGWTWSHYQQHTLSFGLRVVPVVAPVGAVAAGGLTVATLALLLSGRDRAGKVT